MLNLIARLEFKSMNYPRSQFSKHLQYLRLILAIIKFVPLVPLWHKWQRHISIHGYGQKFALEH